MKKWFLLILTMAMVLTGSALAEERLNAEQLARMYLPEGVLYLSTEKEDNGCLELHFWLDATKEFYDVELDEAAQKVYTVESEMRGGRGSNTITLSEQDAQKSVLALYPDAVFDFVSLHTEDGTKVYKVLFSNSLLTGEYEINPETGLVIERTLHYQPRSNVQVASSKENNAKSSSSGSGKNSGSDKNNDSGLIGTSRATQIALSKAGGGRLVKIKQDKENGKPVYEGEIRTATHEIEFEIDAKTGAVLDWDSERLDDDD